MSAQQRSDSDMDVEDLSAAKEPNELPERTRTVEDDDVKNCHYDFGAVKRMPKEEDDVGWKWDNENSLDPTDANVELSEDEQVVRLPSENEVSDVAAVQHRSNTESITNFYRSSSQATLRKPSPSNDCLNFNQQEREAVYFKHGELFENWKYSDEERAFLRHRVETFSREQCILHCILGHMLMTPDEMLGTRQAGLRPDDARQALLCLAVGSHWDVQNLAIIMAFSEKLNVEMCISRIFQGSPIHPVFLQSLELRFRVSDHFRQCLFDYPPR